MPHQVTITGKTGPDRTVTAAVLADVSRVDFQINDKRLQIHQVGANNVKEFDLAGTATVTYVIASGNHTLTISS